MQSGKPAVWGVVAFRLAMAMGMFLLCFFLVAGTWDYWQAWTYIGLVMLSMAMLIVGLKRLGMTILRRRMNTNEPLRGQKWVIALSVLVYLLTYCIPGLDKRYGWSSVTVFVSILADIGMVISLYAYYLVIRENQYASRVIEVMEGQQVISTGPYALVRHPMYLAMVGFTLFTPLALGSWWALLPAAGIIPVLVARIIGEERLLIRDLPGYSDYIVRTRYRMIPWIW